MAAADASADAPTPEPAAAQGQGADAEAAADGEKKGLGQYFRWRPLPWWVVFFLGIYVFAKLLVIIDSPCAVLGTQSPVGMSDVKKAFRTLSMCTHPDRLRGCLKRQPTAQEERRGEIIFKRASDAKDEIQKVLKGHRGEKVACYQGEMETAILQVMMELGKIVSMLGITDVASFVWEGAVQFVTFKNGFMNTLFSFLWLAFLFRQLKQFVMYFWRLGVVNFVVSTVTTVIIGPLPTVLHFFALPFLRIIAFAGDAFGLRDRPADAETPAPAGDTAEPGQESNQVPESIMANSSASLPVAKDSVAGPRAALRQRKKKETPEDKERRNKELLTGGGEAGPAAGAVDLTFGAGPMPENLWRVVNWGHRKPVEARKKAAEAVQFDFLLIMTKPIIPLFMLIASGQVWNGLISSLLIGHGLRRWVPQMSCEAHHLLCAFFGVIHTLLGVSSRQVEDYANSQDNKVLHLAWSISFKDILSIMHMCMLGSTVTAAASLGNEPSYAASFGAGIALRIAIAQDSIRGFGIISTVGRSMEVWLRSLGIVLDAAEDVVAYSGGGIGDCGGGPLRMLFGEGQARWAAVALKAWLMLLPALAAMQWLQRTLHAGRNMGKRFKLLRFVQRAVLSALGIGQLILFGRMELNASNGALDNFWIAMLIGCVVESLLSTFDIRRGPVRQILFLILFLMI
uniref:Uncharacterized protein n=1 Tax=Alexandrium catenella TaxID=2925 RepID=A0A7S1S932_ALECA